MKSQKRRNEILAAATECFAKRGYHATQVSDIIEAAGIARGTFYLYFESKEVVFREILDAFLVHIGEQIKTIKLGGALSPADQMRANVERVVDTIIDNPAPAKIVFNEAVGLNPEIDEKLREFYDRLIERTAISLSKGMKLGLVRKTDPRIGACIILGAFRELMVQRTVFGNSKISRKAIVEGLLDVLLRGFAGMPVAG
ncbi:MAG: TetR/AcrR family transcriptional regulator [bacterium]